MLACNPISFNLDFLNQLMCTLFAWTADVMKYLSICEIDGNYTDVFFRPNLKITTFLFKWLTDKLIDNAKKKSKQEFIRYEQLKVTPELIV